MNSKLLQNLETASEKVARIMSATGVAVVFKPGLKVPMADIEHGVVYVPALPEKLTPEELTKARCCLDHETAHIIFTKDADGNPIMRPDGLDGLLQNGIEDGRINRLMGDRFIGSRSNIAGGEAIYFKALREKHAETYPTMSPDEKKNLDRFTALFRVISRYVERLPEATIRLLPDESFSDGIPADLKAELEAIETAEDVLAAVPKVKAWLFTDPESDEPESAEDGDDSDDTDDEPGDDDTDDNEPGDDTDGSDGADGKDDSDGEPGDDDSKDSDGDDDSDGEDNDEDTMTTIIHKIKSLLAA